MAKQSKPEKRQVATLTSEQMRSAIPKLERRIAELDDIDLSTFQESDTVDLNLLRDKIETTLVDIFGNNTVEYGRFSVRSLNDGSNVIRMAPPSLRELRDGYERGIYKAKRKLETVIELFEEKVSELGESGAGKAMKAYDELDIHPEIRRAVEKLFLDGHYANAVEDACKVLDGLVKVRSGRDDLTGTPLMQTVFSPKTPILQFNDLETDTDISEQQGMMFLYAGAMLALRNPRAHEIIEDDPEKALEYIAFLSLLCKSLDKARRA